jgi:hypothetical protein
MCKSLNSSILQFSQYCDSITPMGLKMKKTLILVLFFTAFSAFAQTTREVVNGKLVVYTHWYLEKYDFMGKNITSLEFINYDALIYSKSDPHQGPAVIPAWCFRNNYNLTTLNLPFGIKRIERGAFENCAIAELSFSEGLEYIGPDAFFDNFAEVIKLPKSLKYLDLTAFLSHYPRSSSNQFFYPTKIWIGDNVEIPFLGNNGFYNAYEAGGHKAGWYEYQDVTTTGSSAPSKQMWAYLGE